MSTTAAPFRTADRPYPGLRPFEPHEAAIFRGREGLVSELIERMECQSVLLVHGGSGSGKSSLVRAGMLPTIGRLHRLGGKQYRHAIIRPSEGPFTALAAALAQLLGAPERKQDGEAILGDPPEAQAPGRAEDADAWSTLLLGDQDLAARIETRVEEGVFETVCLVIDQFEEIFSWARDRRRSDVELMVRFVEQVSRLAAARRESGPCEGQQRRRFLVLLTMRSDFLGACSQYPKLARVINANQFYLPPLEEEAIAQAITEPAAMFGGTVAPDLCRQLMIEAAGSSDPLPLLQHKLMRMTPVEAIEQGEAWEMTVNDLTRVSGDSNALSNHADEIWVKILRDHGDLGLDATEWVFRALFDVEKSGEAIRRPRDFSDLVAVVAASDDFERHAMAEIIVTQFEQEGANFLIRSRGKEGEALDRVDISHEALLRNWTRIAGHPKTGDKGWKRREVEAGLLWRTLTYSNRWWDTLAPSTQKVAKRLFAAMRAAPMRARRYLPPEDQRCDPTKARDWKIVEGLLLRTTIFSVLLGALVVFLICVVIVFGIGWQRSLLEQQASEANARAALVRIAAERQQATAANILNYTDKELLQARAANLSLVRQLDRIAPEDPAVQASLNRLSVAAAPGLSSSDGYIWIADGSPLMIADLAGTGVAPKQVRAGAVYQARFDIALRKGLPSLPNVSADRLGSVLKGDRVKALEVPRLWAQSGQYWLRVAPQTSNGPQSGTTVYVQTARYAAADRDAFVAALRGAGYTLPGIQQVPAAAGTSSVRYCNKDDATSATALAQRVEAIRGLVKGSITVTSIGNYAGCTRRAPKGVFELWLDHL